MRSMVDILHAYTHKHVYTLIPRVCSSLSAKWCYALILTLWVSPKAPISLFSSYSISLTLSLSLFFLPPSLSGSVSLPPAVWMAGSTALGCLGSGGIPISSSNHDIILPQQVKDVARIFLASLFCSLPSNYTHYMLPAAPADSISFLKNCRSWCKCGRNACRVNIMCSWPRYYM